MHTRKNRQAGACSPSSLAENIYLARCPMGQGVIPAPRNLATIIRLWSPAEDLLTVRGLGSWFVVVRR